MASSINASTTSGIVQTADTSGILNLQTANTTAVTIDASQNVGVGVTPSAWSTGTAVEIDALGNSIWAAGVTNMYVTSGAYYNTGFKYAISGFPISNYAQSSGQHIWSTAPSGTAGNPITFTQAMALDASGNLLVGTTSATAKLTIKGTGTSSATKAFWTSNSAGSELLYVRDDGALYSGAGAASPYDLTTAAAANMVVAADRFIYRSTSALKYKQNIRDLPSIDINKFRPVVYNSKCNGDNQAQDYFGLIADEVDAAGVKELVTYGIDGEVEGFQYERLTVVLVKAIQEQQALITSLTARLDEQQAQISVLQGAK